MEEPAGGTHSSAVCPNAERGREKKIQCNILFGINSLSLLQEHLISCCLPFLLSQSGSHFLCLSHYFHPSPLSSCCFHSALCTPAPPHHHHHHPSNHHPFPFIVSFSLLWDFVKLSLWGVHRERGRPWRGLRQSDWKGEHKNLETWGMREGACRYEKTFLALWWRWGNGKRSILIETAVRKEKMFNTLAVLKRLTSLKSWIWKCWGHGIIKPHSSCTFAAWTHRFQMVSASRRCFGPLCPSELEDKTSAPLKVWVVADGGIATTPHQLCKFCPE